MYSDEMLKKRHALRSHPDVIKAVKQWWEYLPKQGEIIPEEGTPLTRDGSLNFGITKPVYCAIVVVIQMVSRELTWRGASVHAPSCFRIFSRPAT